MSKYLIGLGCSWVQGEGGYTDDVWHKYSGRINKPMHQSFDLIPMENEHSWVNVLCKNHLTDYTPVNLGQRGIGNRGAAKCLYLTNIDWSQTAGSTVVYMLSGFDRFDFFKQEPPKFEAVHPYKDVHHYNFQTMWPHPEHSKLWDAYSEGVYSDTQSAMETYANIMEVQTFCQAHDLNFIMANAFDGRGKQFIEDAIPTLVNNINWNNYLHTHVEYESFLQLLVELDGLIELNDYYGYYQNLKWPAKYLTNCIHPTIDGYLVIAEELAKFIKART